jgi:hypothetical protein
MAAQRLLTCAVNVSIAGRGAKRGRSLSVVPKSILRRICAAEPQSWIGNANAQRLFAMMDTFSE